MVAAVLVVLALAAEPAGAGSTAAADPFAAATATATPNATPTSTPTPNEASNATVDSSTTTTTTTTTSTTTSTISRGPRRVGGFLPPPVFTPTGTVERVVLLLPDGSPGMDTVGWARSLAKDGALVALLDTRGWTETRARSSRCAYPAGDLEVLAQQVEKERGLDAYQRPTVVGLGEGASVAWAAIAQAPPGTFAGAVLVDPCLDRPLPLKLCAGSGPKPQRLKSGDLPRLARSPAPVEVLAGRARRECSADAPARLAGELGARLETFEAGHGADAEPGVSAALRAALARLPATGSPAPAASPVAGDPESVSDLPLVEVPAAGSDPRLAVLITGDGGWVGIDKALAGAFAEEGVATVGLDALKYFWKRRTPEETAQAITRILRHYAVAWGRREVILVGYSRGADLAPFVAARLGPAERERLRLVALLGPGTFAEFEVHAIDIFSNVRRDAALPTEDPLRATAGRTRFLCVRGKDEKDSLCPHLEDLPWVKQVVLEGGHHFDGDYRGIARLVLEAAGP